jgi:diguanylate cyclase (GGDEF)-like protein
MESRDVSCDTGGGESPTQLVRQILRHRDPVSQPANGAEDIAATVSVMLRVQPPSKALLMVGAELCERLRLALQEAGFEVTIAPTKDRAIDALASHHHTLAVTDRHEFVRSLRALGTSRVLQIIQIISGLDGELEAALSCGADECLNGKAPDMLLQARFSAARRMSDLESALRATFIVGHRLATTDQLTGVANRRFYAKHYPREISRAARYGHAVSVAMCDIDHFKRANDEYGHAAGDMILRECAQRMQQCLHRGSDWMARVGGDEFAVVFPETAIDRALDICRKMRDAVSSTPFVGDGMQVSLTASFGLASLRGAPKDAKRLAERLLSAADQALYQRKAAGRNGVTATKLQFGSGNSTQPA